MKWLARLDKQITFSFKMSDESSPNFSLVLCVKKEGSLIFRGGKEAFKYYKLLLSANENGSLISVKSAWEKDLGVSFDDLDWAKICTNGRTLPRDLRVRLMQFKILHRFYWSQHSTTFNYFA